MKATRRQKHLLTVADPLRDAGILEHILGFLPGNWLFLGAVCREWQLVYAGIADQQVCSASLYRSTSKLLTCGTKTTVYNKTVLDSTLMCRPWLSCESWVYRLVTD
jgi:hypothetical protein